jgi:hypothetical protein
VAAHRRVPSPLGVDHRHALKKNQLKTSVKSSLLALVNGHKIVTTVKPVTSLEDTSVVIPAA